MLLNVFLEEDVLIKQGDMAGPEEHVYFILEGNMHVILERRDFLYFNRENVELFLHEHEDASYLIDDMTKKAYLLESIKEKFSMPIQQLTQLNRNKDIDVVTDLLENLQEILDEDLEEVLHINKKN